LREWVDLKRQIAHKMLVGPGQQDVQVYHDQLARWQWENDRREADLARQIPEMNLEHKLRAVEGRAVASGLPEGFTLVEFLRFRLLDFQVFFAGDGSGSTHDHYLAWVLQSAEPDSVKMIDLGAAEPIDQMINDFRIGIIGGSADRAARDMLKPPSGPAAMERDVVGLALREAVFDPLLPALRGDRLLLSPDGDLAYLPFEVLPCDEGRRLIDDYRISYLSCGRDVLRFGSAAPGTPDEPLVMADPDFDLEVAEEPAIAPSPNKSGAGFWSRLLRRRATGIPPKPERNPAVASPTIVFGRRSRDLAHEPYHFDRLPGTRAEGEAIGRLLGVRPWLDVAALEGRLKSRCSSPRVLHLATHGFFLPDQPQDPARAGFGLMEEYAGGLGRRSGPLPENPMLRSGLALAGANTFFKGGRTTEEAEDGLLTADDVTGLDLLATDLVVLSACETGLGRLHAGEGVFGLRRAFVLAGAKTLVMSLWKVPDEPTRDLMEDFYRRLLIGEACAQALREAQLETKIKYPDPYYWGAFICQGDPRPLVLSPSPRS
jgi:hypothetical protein